MRSYIHTMQTRPESDQKRHALIISAGCTVLIFSIWTLAHIAFPGENAGSTPEQAALVVASQQDNIAPADNTTTKLVTPFEDLVSGIKESYDSLKDTLTSATHDVTNDVR